MKARRALFLALTTTFLATVALRAADDPFAWPPITAQQKPWAFNWWMGSAVDKMNLTHELERYSAAGLGGIHIIPIYGAKGYEDKYIDYLSPHWMEMMGWAVSEAHRLGMDVDMTTGTGWCFGGPQVSDEDANANVVVKTYEVKAGGKLDQKFNRESTQALVAYSPEGKAVELTDKIAADGGVEWTAPDGTWTVYAISQKPSGQKVKRAAPGGEGWMLNLFYPQAMDRFLQPYTAAFAAYTGPKPRAMYHDSYEYRSDWSPVFFAEFEKRRGYRLQTELPALFSKNPDEHAARVLCDYRQTVSEIMAEESLPKWTQWAHDHGFITRDQAHGSPGNWLDLYAAADIPETEFFSKQRNILVSKFASSATHVKGGNLTSSESCTWMEEHFTETLGEVKGLMDELFLSGINHVFYHGCCYSPDEAGWPGWHFYAATEMNPRNSIWHDASAVNEYIARVQSILQSGKSDNDVLLYWPIEDFWMQPGGKLLPQLTVNGHDWFEGQPIESAAKALWNNGYAFDYVSDAQLKAAKVVGGKVQVPGGKYQVIVVPPCKYIPLETFKQLLALAESGATLVFEKQFPEDAAGWGNLEEQSWWFQKEKLKLEGIFTNYISGKNFEKGTILLDSGENLLSLWKLETPHETMVNSGLSFIRRSSDDGWSYFIANRTETNFDGWITLARPTKSVIILDPMTGNSGVAASRQSAANSPEIHVQLTAGGSVILRAFADKQVKGPAWNYWQTSGAPAEITGNWNVSFMEGGPTLPATFQTAKLGSWTANGDTNTEAFAGTAKYETTFDAPAAGSGAYFLDLGNVSQSARVSVNGKDYGKLITSPFRVVVADLKPTGNVLDVEVTSVTANRIRDLDRRGVKWKTFRDINIVNINYQPFDASNWSVTDCGLLGPVTLTAVTSGK